MSADDPFAQRIATAIKRWRLRFGWSQLEASWRVGVLPPEISRWETALRTPLRAGASDDELRRIIHACLASKAPGHGINDPWFLQPRRPMSAIGG